MKRILYIIILGLFTSCLGTKKIIKKSTVKTAVEKLSVKKDSVNVVERNGKIKDQILTVIPKTETSDKDFNARVDKAVDGILSKLNSSKSSGANSYKSRYDKDKRQLKVDFEVAQTENKLVATNSDSESEKSQFEKLDSYVYKRITTLPWWLYIVIYFLFLDGKIVGLLSAFIPQLKGASSILSIFKRK